MGIFTPPDLFAALGLAARGNADLADGVHIRLMPSPVLGFPVAPFGIYRVQPILADAQVLWRDREGKVLAQPSLDGAGGVLLADLSAPSLDGSAQDVAVELVTDSDFEGSVALLDRVGNRVYAERSRPPFIVGGPRVERVMIRGRGRVVALRTWRVEMSRMAEMMLNQAPIALLSLPIEGSRPWYANGRGIGAALDEVFRGAPLRLSRPDRPDGPFDPLTPPDDVLRVAACVAKGELDPQCEAMVGDIAVLPGQQRHKADAAATAKRRKQFVDISIASTLLAQAMDPGVGRYLGLVGTLRESTDGSRPMAYAAIGLFAYSPTAISPDGRPLGVALGARSDLLGRLEEAFADRVKALEVVRMILERHGNPLGSLALGRGLEVRSLLAVAGAVPPADPPRLGAATLGRAKWLDGNGQPSTAFQQEFLFPAPPLGALVALGRLDAGAWASRHVPPITLDPPANPRARARAMLLGRTQAKPHIGKLSKATASYLRRGLISDAPIPADVVPAHYRAALADLFGRFGRPVEFDVPTPARPRPPAPAPQTRVVLDGPEGTGGPPASPGHLDVSFAVPSVSALAAGSLDIMALELAFDGVRRPTIAITPIPAEAAHEVTDSIPLPALAVGKTGEGTLSVSFVDSAGVHSETVQIAIKYADRRRPYVVPTGLGLIWTSRPGPAPDVELKLTWPGDADTRYRVYIADEKSLALAGASRAEVAVEGGQRDRARTLGGRDRFRLLGEPPLGPSAGSIVLNERLPRALTTVQFLKVVPLTKQGREAEFDDCGVVPIAVPSDRTPPPPQLRVSVDAVTRVATITVVAAGLDLVELKASEPGLFTDPPEPAAVAPEFRLRRASSLVSDPIYAREIARGPLHAVPEGTTVRFTAEVDDPAPLGSFVRYSYWAEVRMPPERRLARGIVELPPAGGVGPVMPAQIADLPRSFSAASAPATAVHMPLGPVPSLEDAAASIIEDAGALRASLTAAAAPSVASTNAIGTYRLRLWEQWGDQAIGQAIDIGLDGAAVSWEGSPDVAAKRPRPLTLRLVTIDPVGRESAMTTISAP